MNIDHNDSGISLGDILHDALVKAEGAKTMNKLVQIQHGNPCYLGFSFNKKIEILEGTYSFGGMSIGGTDDKYGVSHIARILHTALLPINLVEEVTVRAYDISIKFNDGFENDRDERSRIIDEATAIIKTILFGENAEVSITTKDDRGRHSDSLHDID